MKRSRVAAAFVAVVVLLLAFAADAGQRGYGRRGYGRGYRSPGRVYYGPRVVVRPPVFIGGFAGAPIYFPNYYPYGVPYPVYVPPPPPPPPPGESEAPPEEPASPVPQSRAEARRTTYGLVQLRGVPEGAAVDLDGRFWLKAIELDGRWLALPAGEHQVVVHLDGERTVERTVTVTAGEVVVVRFRDRPA